VSDTVKTRIVSDLMSAIENVTKKNGYNRTVRKVSTTSVPVTDAQRDLVFITTGNETKTDRTNAVTECSLTVMIGCVVEDFSDLMKAVHDISADVTKAILSDPTRGGLAVDTRVSRIEDQVSSDLEPLGSCIMEVQIRYRHAWGDPYTVI